MSLSIDITDQATPVLERMHATLADRRDLNQNIGARIESLCKQFVQQDQDNRHNTANALGADPTGFLAGAVMGIHSTANESGATVDFSHHWFARVGHDVDMEASDYGHKLFTIPADAESYGHRIMIGVDTPRFPGGFWKKSKEKNVAIYVVPQKDGGLKVLYIGVPSVHQPQDRSRLPDDTEIESTVRDELRTQLQQRLRALASATEG